MKSLIPLILVVSLCIFGCGAKNYSNISKEEKITIGVLYFERNSDMKELEPYRAGLTDMFITKFKELMPEMNVIERTKLDNIMAEHQLTEMGAIDPDTAQKIGRLLGAQTLYYGSFTTFGKEMCLDARLVRVETGEILVAGNNRCGITDKNVFDTVDKVAKLVTTRMKANYKELLADVYYSKGRTAEENGDKNGAIGFYNQALKFSPSHQLSKKAIERLMKG